MYIYIYIYTFYIGTTRRSPAAAPRSNAPLRDRRMLGTPSLPTKSLGFRGFDSSRLLILRDGNSHVRRI